MAQLFKSKGYEVTHNAKIRGRSGAEHQIDVLAEYRAPLHISKVVVEAKSYDSPIDKERIMKLIQIVEDIGADHGIIIATSYFTPDAIKTAEGHSVELWNREHLAGLLGEIEVSAVEKGLPEERVVVAEVAIQPRFGLEDARRLISDTIARRARGGFLGAGKIIEVLESIVEVYYPYYEAELDAAIFEEEKTGLLSKRTVEKIVTARVSIDAVMGDLVRLNEVGISYDYSFLRLLNEDEIRVMRGVPPQFGISNVLALGFSQGKATKIVSSLVGKGLIQRRDTRPVIYIMGASFPSAPHFIWPISAGKPTKQIGERDSKIIPRVEPSAVIRALESYWTKASVKRTETIYYPYFIAKLRTQTGSRRIEVLDGITGGFNEAVGQRITGLGLY